MTEDLRVDTGLVRDAGGRLQAIAADLPDPPPVHRPTGSDALSAAIAAKVTEVVDPVIAHMPIAKQALTQYAQKVVVAAGVYDAADRQLAEEILKRVEEFGQTFGGGGSSGLGEGEGATVTADGSPTASAQQGGQLASMMQMPVQMAQQAAQAPTQLAGMAGSVPQVLQQGAQQAMQQIGQLSEMTGDGESKAAEPDAADSAGTREDEAAPGFDSGERTPDALAPPMSKSHEPNRAGPEIVL